MRFPEESRSKRGANREIGETRDERSRKALLRRRPRELENPSRSAKHVRLLREITTPHLRPQSIKWRRRFRQLFRGSATTRLQAVRSVHRGAQVLVRL